MRRIEYVGSFQAYLFTVVGFELRASNSLPLEPCPPPPFASVIFQIVSHIFAQG
jgi:hypothetical protein